MTSAGTRVGGHSAADATAAPHPGVTAPVVPSGAERGAGSGRLSKKGLAVTGLGLLTVATLAGRLRRRKAGGA